MGYVAVLAFVVCFWYFVVRPDVEIKFKQRTKKRQPNDDDE